MCTYGGAVKHDKPNYSVDYLMHATDEDWACMGEGKFGCGAMGAMTTGKLKFQGPRWRPMGVMGPFDGFLTMTGRSLATRPPARNRHPSLRKRQRKAACR